jgi:hypothetical protein
VSRVAGRAVLVGAGESPSRAAVGAAYAGASLVLVAGDRLPAGALGGGEALVSPVLGVPEALLPRARAATDLVVSVGAAHPASGAGPHVAGFSSWGLAFGGHPKPEVAGPGVGILTVDPGTTPRHLSRFVLVDGASAAAAVVAGEAAIAVQARPQLTAPELKSVLVGTADGLHGQPSSAQGNGVIDLAAAASVEVATAPATLAFGRAGAAGWTRSLGLAVRNTSTRWLRVYLSAPSPSRDLALSVDPKTLTLGPGQSADVQVSAHLAHATSAPVISGMLTVAPLSGRQLRVPWAVVTAPVRPDLIGSAQLSAKAIKPSDVSPAVLLVQLGRVDSGPKGVTLEPVLRLDIRLLDHAGRDLGLLSRLRDVLPGRYAFGITGRGPNGGELPLGQYTLRLLVFPAAGGPPVTRSVVFTLR